MVARLLNLMGLYFGTEDSGPLPESDLPKGSWERNDVVKVNDLLLATQGATWRNVVSFQPRHIPEALQRDFQRRISEIVLRMETQRPWFIKDPRLSLTLPLWQPVLEMPVYVIPCRDPLEIALSLERRDRIPLAAGLALWHRYSADLLNATRGGKRIFVSHAKLISDPVAATAQLADDLEKYGVHLPRRPLDQEIVSFIDPKLYRAKQSSNGMESPTRLSPAQQAVWEMLQPDFAGDRDVVIDPEEINQTLREFLPFELAHSQIEKLQTLESENQHLQNALLAEQEKTSQILAALHRNGDVKASTAGVENGSGKTAAMDDPNKDVIDSADSRLLLLATMVRRLENDLTERFNKIQVRAAEASDTLNMLAPILRPTSRKKTEKYDEIFQIQQMKDRLIKKEKTIIRLMDWLDAMLGTIPLSSSARKARRYYKHWRSRYETSTLKPLPVSLSRLKDDAEIRVRKAGENRTSAIEAENTLRKLLIEIEHDEFFQSGEFSRIYGVAGFDPSVLGKQDDEQKIGLRDFSRGVDPVVSVIIPVHNQIAYTSSCLRSLSVVKEKTPFEVIVVDDASNDTNYQRLAAIEGIQIIRNEKNLGFLESCNKGARAARGRYTLFLNNDVKVLPGWLDSLVQTFQTHPDAGLVGSKLLYPDGSLQEAGGIVWRDGSGRNYGRNDDPAKPEYRFLRETDYCSGACIILPTELLREVDYFDTRFVPAYYEDTDLAFKVRAAGKKIYYQPASEIIHFEGKSNGTDESSGVKQFQVVNAAKFAEKWKDVLDRDHFDPGTNPFTAPDRGRGPIILVLDHYVPTPDHDAGSRSTSHYIRMFQEMGFRVKFIPADFQAPEPHTSRLERSGVEVLRGSWYEEHLRSWLVEHQEHFPFIFSNRSHITGRYLDTFRQMPNTKILYYGHDLGSVRNQRRFELSHDPAHREKAETETQLETAIWAQAHAIYYPSDTETAHVRTRFPQANARTLPLYILEPNTWNYADNLAYRRDLIFVGGFAHPPNEDAVLWFLDHCWPKIAKTVPAARFVIVGSFPTEQIQDRASERVIVTGWISDEKLATRYRESRLAVIPLRYGAGVKGKVIEALHHHVPIVMTSIAAEGLPGVEQISLVRDDPEAFAQGIIDLYNNPALLSKMGNAGGQYVAKHFSKEAAMKVLQADLSQHPAVS